MITEYIPKMHFGISECGRRHSYFYLEQGIPFHPIMTGETPSRELLRFVNELY